MNVECKESCGRARAARPAAYCLVLLMLLGLLASGPAAAEGTFPDARVGTAYNFNLNASWYGGIYHDYKIYGVYVGRDNASLPGLMMDSNGTIHGTPTGTGTYHIYYSMVDADGKEWGNEQYLTIAAPSLTLSPATLPAATIGVAYSQQIVASGGIAPHTLSLGNGTSLPAGMTLSGGLQLAGTPSQAGSFPFTVTITDSATGPGGPFSTQVNYTLVVNKRVQTITFETQPAQTFNAGGSFMLGPMATASSGLPVAYSSQTTQVCTISGSTVTMLASGNCLIAANQSGNDTYAAATTVTQAIAIGKATQGITGFTATPTQPVFVPNGTFTLAATGGASTHPVVFASTSAAVCTVAGNTVTMHNAGTCALTANQAGDANYDAAPQVALDVEIGTATQGITGFTATPTQPVFAPNGTFTLAATGGASTHPVVFASTSAAVCTVAGNTVTMHSAGTCALTANQAGDANYDAAPQVALDVVIGAAAQEITGFTANPAQPVFAPNGTFTLAATGGASTHPVVFASTSAAVCTVAGNTVAMRSAGTCTLTANQAGDANYDAAPQVALDVVIGQAMPTLDWVGDLHKVYGEAAFDLSDPLSDSDGTFSFGSSNEAVAKVVGRTVTLVGAGSTTLVATQAATANYAAATISITLTVDDRPDPAQDPSVIGGLQAQIDASMRFAAAQRTNIGDRLRQVRSSGANPSRNSAALNLSAGHGPELMLPANKMTGDKPGRAHGWGVWTAGSISTGERNPLTTGDGFKFRSDGLTVGTDRMFGKALFGVAAGFGWNDTDFDQTGSNLDASQQSLAAYGLWRASDRWYIEGLLGFGRLEFDITRWSATAGAQATAQRDGHQWFGSLSAGYQYQRESLSLTGYGRVDATHTTLAAYRELGLGLYDLAYREQHAEGSSMALGVEGSHPFRSTTRTWRPFWMVEYRNALEDSTIAGINYVIQPRGTDYLLGLRSLDRSVWAFGLGVDLEFDSGWALTFQVRHEQTSRAESNTSIGLRMSHGGKGLAPTPFELVNETSGWHDTP